ncbi:MAG TPA: hypothetical protein PLS10_09335 [Chitinophagales bacterium]|nr:hypothetical protein [Chitinophagales bacterium]
MQKLFIIFVILSVLSCKKKTEDITGLSLGETNWNLHFKNNNTFSFFAISHLYFKENKDVYNYRSADTISGKWKSSGSSVTITFNNGDIYNGSAVTSDSLTGTLTASGNNGVWYATK